MRRNDEIIYALESFPSEDNCYKEDAVLTQTLLDINSREKWLYLGADTANPNFAKIGITTGDLRSRSSSSANPDYYIFCAFKFKHNVCENDMRNVERDVLDKIENIHRNGDGSSNRLIHAESGMPSECFGRINFEHLFIDLHSIIFWDHRASFVICGREDIDDFDEGEHVDCEFNKAFVKNTKRYIGLMLQD